MSTLVFCCAYNKWNSLHHQSVTQFVCVHTQLQSWSQSCWSPGWPPRRRPLFRWLRHFSHSHSSSRSRPPMYTNDASCLKHTKHTEKAKSSKQQWTDTIQQLFRALQTRQKKKCNCQSLLSESLHTEVAPVSFCYSTQIVRHFSFCYHQKSFHVQHNLLFSWVHSLLCNDLILRTHLIRLHLSHLDSVDNLANLLLYNIATIQTPLATGLQEKKKKLVRNRASFSAVTGDWCEVTCSYSSLWAVCAVMSSALFQWGLWRVQSCSSPSQLQSEQMFPHHVPDCTSSCFSKNEWTTRLKTKKINQQEIIVVGPKHRFRMRVEFMTKKNTITDTRQLICY